MSNYNPETGVRYGYISANSLDPEIVTDLLYNFGEDLTYKEWCQGMAAEHEIENFDLFDELDIDEHYECDEPIIAGEMDGVQYQSSWLGGALNFFIFFSPVQTECALCSPCVPGAGNLNTRGDYGNFAYDVPADWRSDYMDNSKG